MPLEQILRDQIQNYCTKDLPSLLIANGRKIKFPEKYKAFTQGFYKLPEQPIRAAFMSYDEEAQKSYDVVSFN